MKKTIIVSGAAGYGLNTLQFFFENALKTYGYHMLSYKNYMSRIRGGFNFTIITLSDQPVNMIEQKADAIICLDQDGHSIPEYLKEGATVITYKDFEGATSGIDAKAQPMMLLGALLKYFNFPESFLKNIQMAKWSDAVNQSNQAAALMGYQKGKVVVDLVDLGAKPLMRVNGNQAVALGAMSADLRFFSAYPMAPSTGIMMTLSKYETQHIMAVEQVEDEIAGIIAALGASSNGARAMTATSGGGFSLMVEGLGFAGVAELPIVIANVQRPGPATGLPTRTEQGDLEFISRASQGEFPRLLIAPTSIEECYYQTQRAFNMADKYQIPVVILTDQFLADSTATVNKFDPTLVPIERHINRDTTGYKRYDYEKVLNGRKFPGLDDTLIMNDSHTHDEHGHMTETIENTLKLKHRLMSKLDLMKADLLEPEYIGVPGAKRVFIGWGSTVAALRDAVAAINAEATLTPANTDVSSAQAATQAPSVGALLFTDVFPVPDKVLRDLAQQGTHFINVEQNYNNQFGKLIRAETGISYYGSINQYDGRPMTAESILDAYQNYEENNHGKSL